MKTIEKGMYVRTNEGFIARCIKIEDAVHYTGLSMTEENKRMSHNYIFDGQVWDSRFADCSYDHNIMTENDIDAFVIGEPSYNIIDLIRPGDYINGLEVLEIFENGSMNVFGLFHGIIPEDIRFVLTKEQYEMMTYEVKNGKID